MINFINFIGYFDIFKQPVRFTMTKNWGQRVLNGSIGGMILSFALVIILFYYGVLQTQQMNTYVFDTYKSEKITNTMETTAHAEFKMLDYNFMPTLEILQWGEEK